MCCIRWRFDAFGFAGGKLCHQNRLHPAVSTAANIANFTKQMKSIGFSFDWDRCISTCDPEYYKWTQWMFIKLFEKLGRIKTKWQLTGVRGCKSRFGE